MAPEFLFRTETVTGPPGNQTLDDYSRASRLSFFLWDSQPDNELLRAAKDGELHTAQGLVAQVDRMVVSRRFEYGVRSFFSDMLHFDEYSGLEKDAMIYPRFTSNVSAESEEQTLRTLTDLLVTRNGDYRDIFTTRRTFLTPELAAMYNISLPKLAVADGTSISGGNIEGSRKAISTLVSLRKSASRRCIRIRGQLPHTQRAGPT